MGVTIDSLRTTLLLAQALQKAYIIVVHAVSAPHYNIHMWHQVEHVAGAVGVPGYADEILVNMIDEGDPFHWVREGLVKMSPLYGKRNGVAHLLLSRDASCIDQALNVIDVSPLSGQNALSLMMDLKLSNPIGVALRYQYEKLANDGKDEDLAKLLKKEKAYIESKDGVSVSISLSIQQA